MAELKSRGESEDLPPEGKYGFDVNEQYERFQKLNEAEKQEIYQKAEKLNKLVEAYEAGIKDPRKFDEYVTLLTEIIAGDPEDALSIITAGIGALSILKSNGGKF